MITQELSKTDIEKEVLSLREENKWLKEQLEWLKRQLFGKKSEKMISPSHEVQLTLFEQEPPKKEVDHAGLLSTKKTDENR